MSSAPGAPRAAAAHQLAAVAAVTVAGWQLFDLASVAASPEPSLAAALLPASAISVALGALAGAGLGLWRGLLPAAVAVALAASAWTLRDPAPYGLARAWLAPDLLLLMLGGALAAWLVRRQRLPLLRSALAVGASAAALSAAAQGSLRLLSWAVWTAALGAVLGARLPRRPWRAATAWAAAVVPLACIGVAAHQYTRLPRPDQPLAAAPADQPRRPNLLLIVLDTVRADRLAPYGYARATTPGIDAFVAARATRYAEARSASSWTLPAHGALFTGLPPSDHGADHSRVKGEGYRLAYHHAQPLRADVPTLAERLAAHGYATAAIVGNSMYLAHPLGLDRGFQHYDDRWGAKLRHYLLVQAAGAAAWVGRSVYRGAERITDLGLDWLAARPRERPFFLFLNYMDAHLPRLPPPPFDAAFGSAQPPDPQAPPLSLQPLLYDRKLAYTDAHVTRLLDALAAQGLLDDTVVIITSDHGEAFGEHCFWAHDNALYDEVLRVPLYVKRAGQRDARVARQPLSGQHVFGMALEAVGLPLGAPAGGEVLAELYPDLESPPTSPTGCRIDTSRRLLAWLEGRTKWIASSNGAVEAYALDSDGGETHDLAADGTGVAEARARATAWWAAHPPIVTTGAAATPRTPDAADRERLRSLGY